MNGAHLASPIRGEPGYAHWPQLMGLIGCGRDVLFPDAKQGCAWSRNIISNFHHSMCFNLGPCSLMSANVARFYNRC